MPVFYAVTLFVSAFLLFLVQPLVGRLLLPLMGGTPIVWNTCMVFFQAMLLGGYLYSHATTRYLDLRRQTYLHITLLVLTIVALLIAAAIAGQPIALSASLSPQGDAFPVLGMLLVLLLAVGLPFFTVATSAPLLQKWFAGTGHSSSKDPYFLYGASNLGSVLAMIAYPALIEPEMRLADQTWLWTGGFVLLAVMTAGCAWMLWKSPGMVRAGEKVYTAKDTAPPEPLSWARRCRWLLLACAPSSLMLGITTYITLDIASIPLFWIFPLGLYLLTFIIAFTRLPSWFHIGLKLVAPVILLLLVFVMLSGIKFDLKVTFAAHLVTFFVTTLACHCGLAQDRPHPSRLTEFYLLISIGGVLGGIFNTLIAPVIFTGTYEYKLALVGIAMVMPSFSKPNHAVRLYLWDMAIAGLFFCIAMFLAVQRHKELGIAWNSEIQMYKRPLAWIANQLAELLSMVRVNVSGLNMFRVLSVGVPCLIAYIFVERPLRFGLCCGAIFLATFISESRSDVIFQGRSFFGVIRIDEETYHENTLIYHQLIHGTTIHGRQKVVSPIEGDAGRPISYYHPDGPIGDIFEHFSGPRAKSHYAVIGLGTGTLAAYAERGQKLTYYEIDPLVRRIAEDKNYFTFLTDCKRRGVTYEIVMGDARVQMSRRKEDKYGAIFVDAFSSDSIPIHLLTRESVQMYLDHLELDGLLVMHISNRYLNLEPVVARLAEDAKLTAWIRRDTEDWENDKAGSNWVVLARKREYLEPLPHMFDPPGLADDETEPGSAKDRRRALGAIGGGILPLKVHDRWQELKPKPDAPLWTDDFSNLMRIIIW